MRKKIITKIKSRWDPDKILLESEGIKKEAMETGVKNGANLSGAFLARADLSRANLSRANLARADLSYSNLAWANLSRANLSRANLSYSNLSGADLSGADLSGSNLSGAKGYIYSHDVFFELVRRQGMNTFTKPQQAVIGHLAIHRPCYDKIKEQFGPEALTIAKKLADAGFGEYYDHGQKLLKEG